MKRTFSSSSQVGSWGALSSSRNTCSTRPERPPRIPAVRPALPDGAQVPLVICIVAVTHVESGNIHSSRNQLRQAFRS